MRLRLLAALAALALTGVAAVLVLGPGREPAEATSSSVSEHEVEVLDSARTVFVSRTMPLPSAHARRLSAMLEAGPMPQRAREAEVLTDTDCAPDGEMISRCRNVVRLAGGRRLVLRHPHDMTKVPCLAPGERVRLIPADV
jgi:hypothetical protein